MTLNNNNQQKMNDSKTEILNTYKEFILGMHYVNASLNDDENEHSKDHVLVNEAFEYGTDPLFDMDFTDELSNCKQVYEVVSGTDMILTPPRLGNKTSLKLGLILMEDSLLSYKRLRGEKGEFALKELDKFLSDEYMMNLIKSFGKWKEGLLNYINKH
ncbi:hypothetical protein bcgnr5378_06400 [Bacillus cereus]|uniref:hypothetical protein n=1 Tax=Bacillus cereus TaxID=1396 RepID=UPI0007AB2F21|nr:hypothetical protein [Bacillus cereus]